MLPGSRDNKDCKLNAEDVVSAISGLSPAYKDNQVKAPLQTTRVDIRSSPYRSPFQDLSREISEKYHENNKHDNNSDLCATGRPSKVELQMSNVDAENLKLYIQQQIDEAAKTAIEQV